ncbi:MAG: exodeoxyribonuclease V subunit beta, partial [Myxococcales bacterium]
ARALAREDQSGDSDLVRLLRDGTPLEVERRVQRLRDALANYDAATIATTHEFCNAVLRSLGVAGNSDSSTRLLEDVTGLRDEVVGDLYLRRFLRSRDPEFDFRHAGQVATQVLDNAHATIFEEIGDLENSEQAVAGARIQFAHDVRDEVARRKRRQSLITYDDMLSRLADALAATDSAAARRMRARWQIVIVDEFQDTDPVQWQVLDQAFGQESRLILIGDPKQAIYAFRGGDTPTYLRAVEGADMQTLATNWRSDEAVVSGLQAFLGGASLGDDRIQVHPVDAARTGSRLHGLDSGVRLRHLRRDDFAATDGLTKSGGIKAPVWRRHVARDLAADIARTLASGATWDGRPLTAGDIAVLVSEHREIPEIKNALDELGIPSVMT